MSVFPTNKTVPLDKDIGVDDALSVHLGTAAREQLNVVLSTIDSALDQLSIDIGVVQTNLDNHINNAVGAHAASAISVVASGNLASTEAQAAFDEHQGDIDTLNTNLSNEITDRTNADIDLQDQIDDEIALLRMTVTGSDTTVTLASAFATRNDNTRLALPNGTLIADYSGGTINYTTGVITGGGSNFTPIDFSGQNSKWAKYAVILLPGTPNTILILPGTDFQVSAAAVADPAFGNNGIPVGIIAVQDDGSGGSGTINNIVQTDVTQLKTAGGSGGSGDANSITETLKNRLLESPFEAVTPNIFSINESDLLDGASTGAYSAGAGNFEFGAAAETMVSTQMLDADFLAKEDDINEVELLSFWDLGNIDTGATYEVSRDAGVEYQAITMERVDTTEVFRGIHTFAEESLVVILSNLSSNTGSIGKLTDTGAGVEWSQKLGALNVSGDKVRLTGIRLSFNKNGIRTGNAFLSLVHDDGTGKPSEDPADFIWKSAGINANTLSGAELFPVDGVIIVPANGDVHVVVSTDQEYKDTYTSSGGTIFLGLNANNTLTGAGSFDGTTWTTQPEEILYELRGAVQDLRVRITSSTGPVNLEGYGVLYDKAVGNLATGNLEREVVNFKAVADNFNEFTLLNFVPNVDLMNVYYIQAGQVFRHPGFRIDGQKISFDVDQFNNGGVEADVTLVFDQTRGGAFDNSDLNALLLASNNLGSTDPNIDRSSNGAGIFLRRPDGTLREIAIDDNDNIVIYSV